MEKNIELSLEDFAKIVFNYMHENDNHIDLLTAYSKMCIEHDYCYSYQEVKDYLFHHDFQNDF